MPNNTLFFGALILFTTSLFNRILGFVYQYLVMQYIGSEAYGLYQMVFPIYMTALVFTTAGIPLAISKLVSEKISIGSYEDAQKVFQIALGILFFSGLSISLILHFNVNFIVDNLFSDQRVLEVFKICIPAIFIVSVASAFRGYFQGLQNMIPSAVSQVLEQLTRVAMGLWFSLKLFVYGVEWAAAGLALGMLSGELIGLCSILLHYLFRKRKAHPLQKKHESTKWIVSKLFSLSLPVTGSRLMSTGLSALDTMIIPRQLQLAGLQASTATSLFGQFTGTAMTLINFPSVFTFSLATSLVPAISEAVSVKDYRLAEKRSRESIRYTILIGLPSIIALYYFAEPLARIFNSGEVSTVIRILCIGGLFAYLNQTTTGILQGLGKTYLPLVHTVVVSTLRIPLLIYLTGLPSWALSGAALAYVISFLVSALLNTAAVRRHIGLQFNLKQFILQPMSAGLGMIVSLLFLTRMLPHSSILTLLFILIGFLFYILILFFNGGIDRKDISKIPILSNFIR